MIPYYCHVGVSGNFGDEINTFLWDSLIPGYRDGNSGTLLSGIGTIISERMPSAVRWIVFSSGVGYSPAPKDFGDEHWMIIAVRGRLTAKVLGLPPSSAVTDGAILLRLLPEYQPIASENRRGIAFVPHINASKTGNWRVVCEAAGFEYIDPAGDVREVIWRIRKARLVIADAMHAAIVADTMRVPWIPVATSCEINSFKWIDWTTSMNLQYRPTILPPSTLLEEIRNHIAAFCGKRYLLTENIEEEVMAHCMRYHQLSRQRWWRIYVSLFEHTARAAVLGRVAAFRALHRGRDPLDGTSQKKMGVVAKLGVRGSRAVEALKNAALREPFLSDDSVFADRLAEMERRLDCLKIALTAS